MILIEMTSGGAKKLRLEFHPRVTVVAGLSPEQRRWLVTELVGTVGGERADSQLTVDVGGEPQPLTMDLIGRLGFNRAPMDNVVEPADLPGASLEGLAGFHEFAPQTSGAASLELAQRDVEHANEELRLVEEELSSLRVAVSPVEERELQHASALHQSARERVSKLRVLREATLAEQGPTLSPSERLRRARAVKENLQERLLELRRSLEPPLVEPHLVEELLQEAQEAAAYDEVRAGNVALVDDLVEKWVRVTAELQRATEHRGPPEWLVSQTRDDLDHAQARVTALSMQARQGIEVGDQLERAKRQLRDAKEAWDELQLAVSDDPVGVIAERDALYLRIVQLLGGEPEADRVAETLREVAESQVQSADARFDLAELLLEAHVVVPPEHAIAAAVKWLDTCRGNAHRKAQLQQEIAAVALNMQDVMQEISELELRVASDGPVAEIDPLVQIDAEIVEAEQQALVATERLTALRDRSARHAHRDEGALSRLEFRRRDALDALERARRRLQELEVNGHSTSPSESNSAPAPWWEGGASAPIERAVPIAADVAVDMSGVLDEDAEFFVLSRAAGLRRVGRGESLPMIIDAAFDNLTPAVAARVFDVLPRIAPIVQIVYLAGNDVAEKWAKRQSEMLAAVVRLETDSHRWPR